MTKTEQYIRDSMAALEGARESAARNAGDLAELSGMLGGVRDQLAEVMMSVTVRAHGLDKTMAAIRITLADCEARASTLSLERAASCEALTRIVGPPANSPQGDELQDTRPMGLDEIAEMNGED